MKNTGIILLVIGLALTLFTGLTFVTREKVVDIGKLEISANKKHSMSWSPIVGGMAIVMGAGLYLLGRKKSTSF
jgi:LPXTG-motif cell wall-anchored protein